MANQKLTQLEALSSVSTGDIVYIVDDPSGTPISKNCTAQTLVKGGASAGACADIIDSTLTASKNLVSDLSGKITTTDDNFSRWRGNSSSTPTNPQEGDIWNDTTSGNILKIYTNSNWISLN